MSNPKHTPHLADLVQIVSASPKKLKLRMEVTSGGHVDFALTENKKGKETDVVIRHSAPLEIHHLDEMALDMLLALAEKALGVSY